MLTDTITSKNEWEQYCVHTLETLASVFLENEIILNQTQPHISGERFLMQAITTTHGKKLILLGTYKSENVVIKIADDPNGIAEIEHERLCRNKINDIDFASTQFVTPPERAHFYARGFLISIQKFIEQESAFLERPLEDQFTYALSAFKAQEGAHVATHKHAQSIKNVFPVRTANDYLLSFAEFKKNLLKERVISPTIAKSIETAEMQLVAEESAIAQYCGFLTHTDFVPHNIRIADGKMYLLDYSALIFGNKYEGWARFLNFMTLHNKLLERALLTYVHNNRTPHEVVALRMMRLYRLGEILWYYTRTLEKSADDLLSLNTTRIHFWGDVLSYVLTDTEVPDALIKNYQETRDRLRSEDEKKRQQGLH